MYYLDIFIGANGFIPAAVPYMLIEHVNWDAIFYGFKVI